jgi:hypothetical protein
MLLAVAGLMAACRAPHVREKTMRADAADLTPALAAPARAAAGIVTRLRGPESVLYDPEQDVYILSNINGGLLERDGNGFLSRVTAGTLQVELEWVESGRNGVTLDAPKGMAIVGETLFVSDVTGVRKFDRRTGRPLGTIALPGATLINDLTTDGRSVYVSDTGVRPGPGITFLSTGTEAIWKITNDRAEKLASGRVLHQPNGLDFAGGTLRVASFEGNEIYALDGGGKRKVLATLPEGQLDGLIHLADGSIVVTSWLGKEVYRGRAGEPFGAVLAGVAAPADIGYDTKRHLLLLPSSAANQVTLHRLP